MDVAMVGLGRTGGDAEGFGLLAATEWGLGRASAFFMRLRSRRDDTSRGRAPAALRNESGGRASNEEE